MQTSDKGRAFVAAHEGIVTRAYLRRGLADLRSGAVIGPLCQAVERLARDQPLDAGARRDGRYRAIKQHRRHHSVERSVHDAERNRGGDPLPGKRQHCPVADRDRHHKSGDRRQHQQHGDRQPMAVWRGRIEGAAYRPSPSLADIYGLLRDLDDWKDSDSV